MKILQKQNSQEPLTIVKDIRLHESFEKIEQNDNLMYMFVPGRKRIVHECYGSCTTLRTYRMESKIKFVKIKHLSTLLIATNCQVYYKKFSVKAEFIDLDIKTCLVEWSPYHDNAIYYLSKRCLYLLIIGNVQETLMECNIDKIFIKNNKLMVYKENGYFIYLSNSFTKMLLPNNYILEEISFISWKSINNPTQCYAIAKKQGKQSILYSYNGYEYSSIELNNELILLINEEIEGLFIKIDDSKMTISLNFATYWKDMEILNENDEIFSLTSENSNIKNNIQLFVIHPSCPWFLYISLYLGEEYLLLKSINYGFNFKIIQRSTKKIHLFHNCYKIYTFTTESLKFSNDYGTNWTINNEIKMDETTKIEYDEPNNIFFFINTNGDNLKYIEYYQMELDSALEQCNLEDIEYIDEINDCFRGRTTKLIRRKTDSYCHQSQIKTFYEKDNKCACSNLQFACSTDFHFIDGQCVKNDVFLDNPLVTCSYNQDGEFKTGLLKVDEECQIMGNEKVTEKCPQKPSESFYLILKKNSIHFLFKHQQNYILKDLLIDASNVEIKAMAIGPIDQCLYAATPNYIYRKCLIDKGEKSNFEIILKISNVRFIVFNKNDQLVVLINFHQILLIDQKTPANNLILHDSLDVPLKIKSYNNFFLILKGNVIMKSEFLSSFDESQEGVVFAQFPEIIKYFDYSQDRNSIYYIIYNNSTFFINIYEYSTIEKTTNFVKTIYSKRKVHLMSIVDQSKLNIFTEINLVIVDLAQKNYDVSMDISSNLVVFVEKVNFQEKCTKNEFTCHNGQCIDKESVCDGTDQCSDNSDEIFCQYNCADNEVECLNGMCIKNMFNCNGFDDCNDGIEGQRLGSDEKDCRTTCTKDQIQCSNEDKCINTDKICNSFNDCIDGSDEKNCPTNCSENDIQCTDEPKCIRPDQICNTKVDCLDESDEQNCSSKCIDSQWTCTDSSCISIELRCNAKIDCSDSSDELQCETPTETVCKDNEFSCANNRTCIALTKHCNNKNDCEDGSDEIDCKLIKECTENKFKCLDGIQCIPKDKVCDDQADCNDKSDEAKCSYCNIDQIICSSGDSCVASSFQCDGKKDCNDGSDETNCENHENMKADADADADKTVLVINKYVLTGIVGGVVALILLIAIIIIFNKRKRKLQFEY